MNDIIVHSYILLTSDTGVIAEKQYAYDGKQYLGFHG